MPRSIYSSITSPLMIVGSFLIERACSKHLKTKLQIPLLFCPHFLYTLHLSLWIMNTSIVYAIIYIYMHILLLPCDDVDMQIVYDSPSWHWREDQFHWGPCLASEWDQVSPCHSPGAEVRAHSFFATVDWQAHVEACHYIHLYPLFIRFKGPRDWWLDTNDIS